MDWLATTSDQLRTRTVKRFDPRFWTINFPRPMMAAAVTEGTDGLGVELLFYRHDDLAGLIWESEDRLDHPLLSYATSRDYSGLSLRFRWQSQGIVDLAALSGPTLTIEGRDALGQSRAWFVRLWNYAEGSPEDAVVTLDFDQLDGGFLLPAEADPVYPKDIDRMFISMVPPGFAAADQSPLAEPLAGHVTIRAIKADGEGSVLFLGDAYIPPHALQIANGYDDVFNITPERWLRNVRQLGYQGAVDHYVGMSHYFRLGFDPALGRFVAARGAMGEVLNRPAALWHADFFARLGAALMRPASAVSFEMLDDFAPEAWKQRGFDGSPALTGWVPPSTLLSPNHGAAMDYVRDAMLEFAGLMAAANVPVDCQIGEPWWWYQLNGNNQPCFYDAATTALYSVETGAAVPTRHQTIFEAPDAAQQTYLDWLGEKLGETTLGLRDAVKAAYPGARVSCLFFTPQVLIDGAPMLKTVNLPVAWGFPAFDRFQIEDYDHVVNGRWAAHEAALAVVEQALGYGAVDSDYFAGFILGPNDAPLWANVARAIDDARRRGFAAIFVWAYPQVMRDGFSFFDLEENPMAGFHDVRLPDMISFGASGGPGFSTQLVEMASGAEQRNANWQAARGRYDVGGGIRAEADLAALIGFFRARAGRAYGFRFKDWSDWTSSPPEAPIAATDQAIAIADGLNSVFPLVKRYGDSAASHVRTITKPVAGSVRVAVDGVEFLSGWSVDPLTGEVAFVTPPAAGAVISAGFAFDVPVRFDTDQISITLEGFRAGEAPSIPLVEIRG